MKPESAAFLRRAHQFLQKAQGMLDLWPDEAGRAAYLAAFHAAQAFIFERTNSSPKTHGGVHAQFARLGRDDPAFDADLRGFLGRSYTIKAVTDYGTDPQMDVTSDQAAAAIQTATRFVSVIAGLLPET